MRLRTLLAFYGLILLITAACGGSQNAGNGTRIAITPPTPAPTLSPIDKTATAIVGQATRSVGAFPTTCTTGIISETDTDAITRLRDAISGQGVSVTNTNVIVTRDRQTCERSSVVNTFASVRITTADVTDDAAVGNTMASALRGFVVTSLPQPATISLQFEAGTRQRSFNINFSDAQDYLDDDLSGAELIAAIEGQ